MSETSTFCVDCSVTLAWCFEDERTARTDALLDRLATQSALAPAIWCLEVANALTTAERHGRLTALQVNRYVAAIRALPIVNAPVDTDSAFDSILPLARNHGLTAYDASYLALALKTGLPLATNDKDIIRSSSMLGVAVI
jgi:predicted nucleic acid-binding protein